MAATLSALARQGPSDGDLIMALRDRLGFVDNNVWLWGRVGAQAWWDARQARHALARDPDRYAAVRVFCNFIGYPRSGHSVVGSILDAHEEALFSHRLDALGRLSAGDAPEAVFHMIERNSARFARDGRKLTAYAYPVPGQHQGRSPRPTVIGDQEAKWATLRLSRDPELLARARFRQTPALAFIHVVRNPFDNIATLANRTQTPLEPAMETYFQLCDGVERIKARYPDQVLDIRHEDLVADPRAHIRRLGQFLGLSVGPAYLDACAGLVSPAAHRSRDSRVWSPAVVREIERRARRHRHLAQYAYDS